MKQDFSASVNVDGIKVCVIQSKSGIMLYVGVSVKKIR